MKSFCKWLLRLLGWKFIEPSFNPSKSVICVAPHTSNLDFIIGKLYYLAIGRKSFFLAKKQLFFFPLGCLLRIMGGISVNRDKHTHMVDYLANVFSQKDHFHLAITPEGTRSATDNWKTGFYRIALAANVPIQLAAIDFQRKEVGIFELFEPTGNQEEDIAYIRSKYSSEQALFPENFIEYRPLKKRFSIQSISHPLRKAQRRIKYIQRRYQHRYGRTKSFTNKVSHLNNYSGWRKRRSLNQVPKNRKTRALYLSLKRFKSKNE